MATAQEPLIAVMYSPGNVQREDSIVAAKDDAIQELETAYQQFRGKIADLSDDAYREQWLGTWSLSELLAHMEGWWREMAGGFARVAAGQRPTPEGVSYTDADAWNEKFTQKTTAGKDALTAWDAGYGEYVSAARALPDDQYGVDSANGKPRIGNRLLQGAGVHHFAEHEEQLDAWLAGRTS
ncbi:hypothetical protein AYO38_00130 [bacterium SCGC AG-212-C10]|nr:hypothetical protein AYO38_00130 [bacterium SCGC AG-212-C10]